MGVSVESEKFLTNNSASFAKTSAPLCVKKKAELATY
jgi:hypothetical protein